MSVIATLVERAGRCVASTAPKCGTAIKPFLPGWPLLAAVSASVLFAGLSVPAASLASPNVDERLGLQKELLAELQRGRSGIAPNTPHFPDYSTAAAVREYERENRLLNQASAISVIGFSEEDRITQDLVRLKLQQDIADFRLKTYEMPLSPTAGALEDLSDIPISLDSPANIERYVVWLRSVPRGLERTRSTLQEGERDGLVPPRVLVQQIADQCHRIAVSMPYLANESQFASDIPTRMRSHFVSVIKSAAEQRVKPSLKLFCDFLSGDYLAHGRNTIGEWSLPSGYERYRQQIREQTTTDMTPAEVHSLGLQEVARIMNLLSEVASRAGYPSLAAYRSALKVNPRYIPATSGQIVDDFRRYLDTMQPKLRLLFNNVPSTHMDVVAMSPDERPNITHHVDGSSDGKTSSRILVAVSDFSHRSLIGDETTAYHEGLPGHELQISVQQHLLGLSAFRRDTRYNAYTEGWAVYAEALGKDVGLFRDPASDYGRLNTELMRAVRLVVDTGIHADRWDRNRAAAFWLESGAADAPTIEAEIDRSISWPAQGLSYKIGQLKILSLRQRAQAALGHNFNLRDFHDEVLGSGNLPLIELETKINAWILATKVNLGVHSNTEDASSSKTLAS